MYAHVLTEKRQKWRHEDGLSFTESEKTDGLSHLSLREDHGIIYEPESCPNLPRQLGKTVGRVVGWAKTRASPQRFSDNIRAGGQPPTRLQGR